MNKIYPHNKKRNPWYRGTPVVTAALLLAIMISPARSYVSSVALMLASPFWYAGSWLYEVGQNAVGIVYDKQMLLQKEARLTEEVALLKEKLVQLDLVTQENSELKKLLSRQTVFSHASTTEVTYCAPVKGALGALVLTDLDSSAYSSLLLDVGSDQNVVRGDIVYSFGDTALGVVSDVYAQRTRVVLYSAPGATHAAFLGKDHVSVTVQGEGGGTFVAELPKSIVVAEGDVVALAKESPALLGTVARIILKEDAPFQEIYIKTPVNLQALRWVYIGRSMVKATPCLNASR